MRVIIRGIKNAFRNTIRTVSVTLILALSIGLALVMLLSYQTVQSKITAVTDSVGNTITVNPAGSQGFQGGGEPLTDADATAIKGLAHVVTTTETLGDRLTPSTDTNLVSAIDAGTLGARAGRQDERRFSGGEFAGGTSSADGAPVTTQTFTIPIMVTGVSDPSTAITGTTKLTSGALFAVNSTDNVAILGSTLATKNNLTVGSTFTAYSGTTIKVVGIFDAGNEFANSGLYMPLKKVQTLSAQVGQSTEITVIADNINNVDSVVSAIQDKLGSSTVDVTSTKDQADSAVAPLENIKSISLYSLIGALVAGAVITLLIMMMIVRERRREIGVLKAIGSSNVGIVTQFISESLVLTLMGSVVGMILGVVLSNPVLNVLVNNSNSDATATSTVSAFGGRTGGAVRIAQFGTQFGSNVRGALTNLHATVGFSVILYGFLAAILIAIIGSAIPALLIAKVKPAEVMRAD